VARSLTFRFDDGFLAGASKSAAILGRYRASYFVVGDRVLGLADLSGNAKLAGRNFGSIDAWRALAAQGHDIQPHSYSHRPFSALAPEEVANEIRQSVEIARRINDAPMIFAFPFNDRVAIPDWNAIGVAAAGFDTKSSEEPPYYNSKSHLDRYAIRSWAIRERHWDAVASGLRDIPDDSWTVLGLHSLDDEGAEPWSSVGFARLVALVAELGFDVLTARAALEELARRHHWRL
jgi:peptidoglycan/xylan/chitin deacetylase (PgdA/CDA1 family)